MKPISTPLYTLSNKFTKFLLALETMLMVNKKGVYHEHISVLLGNYQEETIVERYIANKAKRDSNE